MKLYFLFLDRSTCNLWSAEINSDTQSLRNYDFTSVYGKLKPEECVSYMIDGDHVDILKKRFLERDLQRIELKCRVYHQPTDHTYIKIFSADRITSDEIMAEMVLDAI